MARKSKKQKEEARVLKTYKGMVIEIHELVLSTKQLQRPFWGSIHKNKDSPSVAITGWYKTSEACFREAKYRIEKYLQEKNDG